MNRITEHLLYANWRVDDFTKLEEKEEKLFLRGRNKILNRDKGKNRVKMLFLKRNVLKTVKPIGRMLYSFKKDPKFARIMVFNDTKEHEDIHLKCRKLLESGGWKTSPSKKKKISIFKYYEYLAKKDGNIIQITGHTKEYVGMADWATWIYITVKKIV